jgi:hypothetical protein
MKTFNFKAQNQDSHKKVIGQVKEEQGPCFPRAIKKAIEKLDQSIKHAEGRWVEGPALWPAMKSACFTFHKSEEGYADKDIVHVFFKVGLEKVQKINNFTVINKTTGEEVHKSLDYFKMETDDQGVVGDKVISTLNEFKAYLENLKRGDNPEIDAMCGRAGAPKQTLNEDNPPKKEYDAESDLWVKVDPATIRWDKDTKAWVNKTNLKEVV